MRMNRGAIAAATIVAAMPAIAYAAPFDPEAATQAYMATLKGAARAKSDAYFEGGYWLLLWGTLVAVLADYVLLRTGLSARFRDWAERVTRLRFVQSMLYAIPYTIIRVHESEADAFGLDVAREPDGFAQVSMKLSEYRKIEPGPVEEALFYDHPSGRTRVRMAMDWKATHPDALKTSAPAP